MTVVTDYEIEIRPTDARRDAPLVQEWLAHPKSAFWGMQELGVGEVADYLADVVTHAHQDADFGCASHCCTSGASRRASVGRISIS